VRNKLFDLVRVLAILCLVPFHSTSILGSETGILTSFNIQATWPLVVATIIDCWQIPVLFVIAGYSMKVSIEKRTFQEFFKERVKRLLVPAAFTIFFPLPLAELITGNWAFTVGHAWFLLFLFLYTGIFIKFKSSWLFLVATPVVAAFTPYGMRLWFFVLLFACGFVIEKAHKIAPFYLVAGLCLLPFYVGHELLVQTFISIGILGSFRYSGKVPFERISMPFYVLHFTVIAVLSRAALPPVELFLFMQLGIPITLVLAWACTKSRVTRLLTGARSNPEQEKGEERKEIAIEKGLTILHLELS
jgi:hypothetical protein